MNQNPSPHRPVPAADVSRSMPILLTQAGEGFLKELSAQNQTPKSVRFRGLLTSLAAYLGPDAPLLAYTKLTGEAWRHTLSAAEQPDAQHFLDEFRDYLRTFGWFDAARPVNQFD